MAKLTDCDGENSETDSALDFALDCGYIAREDHAALTALAAEIGKMLGAMIQQPEKFLLIEVRDQKPEVRDQRSEISDQPASDDR